MKKKTLTILAALAVVAVWAGISLMAWFTPAKESSDSERRLLAQLPELSGETLLDGSFAKKFESYSLDQFPARESFRTLKALFHQYVLMNRDNNGIYIVGSSAAELEENLNESSVNRALEKFNLVYGLYLRDSGCKVYSAVVPDKGYYLAEQNGYPAMDYDRLFSLVETGMPWAQHIDLTDTLTIEDYYRTDLHWRQEKLLPVARKVAGAMGAAAVEDVQPEAVERPFYGVYCGQAALPMEPDTMYLMESPLISGCRVYNYNEKVYTNVHDEKKLTAKDLYDVYLSGPQSLLRIENPGAATDRELVIFRDSFASSLTPLLLADYETVTLVDLRYIRPQVLGDYVDFTGCDVLFLHSTLVLNKNLI